MVTPDMSAAAEELTYCEVHPDRETGLRCNKCGRYMCVDCAVSTPVGYRCKECVRGIEDKFFNATSTDYVIMAAVCALLAGIGGAIVSAVGLPLLFMLILGLPIGGGIAEVALRAIKRHRGRYSAQIATAAAVVGGLVGSALYMYVTIINRFNEMAAQFPAVSRENVPMPSLDTVFTLVINNFSLLIFIGIIAFAVYGRFKMRM